MQQIQFIQITPQQLQELIIEGVKIQLEDLKKNFQPKEPTELLTRSETAKLLKINLSTLHHWCKRGIIQSYGISSRVYFKRSEIEKVIIKLN